MLAPEKNSVLHASFFFLPEEGSERLTAKTLKGLLIASVGPQERFRAGEVSFDVGWHLASALGPAFTPSHLSYTDASSWNPDVLSTPWEVHCAEGYSRTGLPVFPREELEASLSCALEPLELELVVSATEARLADAAGALRKLPEGFWNQDRFAWPKLAQALTAIHGGSLL